MVPPGFHETSAASSIFGSQHSDDEGEPELFAEPKSSRLANGRLVNGVPASPVSPAATIRRNSTHAPAEGGHEAEQPTKADRRKWKTLRDFVDDRAIEDILETIENDRNHLEVSFVNLLR